jgi:hypothetical protein
MDAAELLASKQLRETTVTVQLGGDGVTADIRLRALPRRAYRELLDAHPARPEDGEKADWNADTFPPALIAASAIDPELAPEQAQKIWDEWELSEVGTLFLACWSLNEQRGRLGFTLPGFGMTTDSGPSSTTASPGESPTPTSSPGKKTTRTKRSPG